MLSHLHWVSLLMLGWWLLASSLKTGKNVRQAILTASKSYLHENVHFCDNLHAADGGYVPRMCIYR